MLDDVDTSRGELVAARDPLQAMHRIADLNPTYRAEATPGYRERMFEPAVDTGQYAFIRIGDELGFFTFLTPARPILTAEEFSPATWRERGPVLWIGDVCSTPKMNGVALGKAVRHWVKTLGLAPEGAKVVFWRPNRLGFFYVR